MRTVNKITMAHPEPHPRSELKSTRVSYNQHALTHTAHLLTCAPRGISCFFQGILTFSAFQGVTIGIPRNVISLKTLEVQANVFWKYLGVYFPTNVPDSSQTVAPQSTVLVLGFSLSPTKILFHFVLELLVVTFWHIHDDSLPLLHLGAQLLLQGPQCYVKALCNPKVDSGNLPKKKTDQQPTTMNNHSLLYSCIFLPGLVSQQQSGTSRALHTKSSQTQH